jgi:hypothetical protein
MSARGLDRGLRVAWIALASTTIWTCSAHDEGAPQPSANINDEQCDASCAGPLMQCDEALSTHPSEVTLRVTRAELARERACGDRLVLLGSTRSCMPRPTTNEVLLCGGILLGRANDERAPMMVVDWVGSR